MGRKKRSRRGRRGTAGLRFIETFTFSVQNGFVSEVKVSTLANRPPRSNFRPIWFEVEVVQPWVPATGSIPGYFAPGAIQLSIRSPAEQGDRVAVSPLTVLGSAPRRVRVSYPASADWYDWNTQGLNVVATIEAVCTGPITPGTGYIRGIGRMLCAVQTEDSGTICPTFHIESGPSGSQATLRPQ